MDVDGIKPDDVVKTPCDELESGIARERFLMLIGALKGKRMNFTMHERTHVSGVFETMNREGNAIAVRALETPLGKQESALLRVSDIISMTVDLT